MRRVLSLIVAVCIALLLSVAQTERSPNDDPSRQMAVVYYWKAKSGKMDEYSRYIKEVAEPIDHDAQQRGAFISVVTYVSQKSDSPWTHMRVFTVPDKAHGEALGQALDEATNRIVSDPAKRKSNSEYAATLRDPAGSEEWTVLSRIP